MISRVEVFVQLKEGMLDPQGETLENALESMGYAGVSEMRVGKWITFSIEGGEPAEIERRVDEMCRRLLANPVIETYRYEISTAERRDDEGAASDTPERASDDRPAPAEGDSS